MCFLIHLFWRTLFWENFHQKSFPVAGRIDTKSRWRPRNHSPKPPYLGDPQIPKQGIEYLFSVWHQGEVSVWQESASDFFSSKMSWKNILGDHTENFQSCTINSLPCHLCYQSIIFSHDWILGPSVLLKSIISSSPFFVRGLLLSLPFPREGQKLRNIFGIFTSTENCDLFCSIILCIWNMDLKFWLLPLFFMLYIIPFNWFLTSSWTL